jgi:hypothetical protein
MAWLMLLMFGGTAGAYWIQGLPSAAVFLWLGLGYGFVFYKSCLCFASAFYGKRPELLRGILLGLLVASVGSTIILALGLNRISVVPYGAHTLIGSLLFGFALPFTGGCMTGTLYRLGGGQTKSLFTFIGLLVGNGLGAAYAWQLTEPLLNFGWRFYLPDFIGLVPTTLLNVAIITWLYRRLRAPTAAAPASPASALSVSAVMQRAWPAWVGGLAVAALFVAQFAYQSVLTVQLPLARFSLWLSSALGLSTQGLAWANFWGLREPAQDPGFHLDVGLIAGAMIASLVMNEFAYFRDWNVKDAFVGWLAGLVMGVAVWLAIGCNVSGFWGTVATLRFEGWLYAIGMFIGVRLGLRALTELVARDIL